MCAECEYEPANAVPIWGMTRGIPLTYWRAIEQGVRNAHHWPSHPNLAPRDP